MIVHICSMFRDSQTWKGIEINQVDRYFHQFATSMPLKLQPVFHLLEGDSQDDTAEALQDYKIDLAKQGIECNLLLGRENKTFKGVASTAHPARIKGMSNLADQLLDSIDFSQAPISEQFVLWIESDFVFFKDLIFNLLNLSINYNAVVAPLPLSKQGDNIYFYDTWAFEFADGSKWTNTKYEMNVGPFTMNSIGSCALIPADYIRHGVRFGDGAFRELCSEIKKMKGLIICDTNTHIYHPMNMIVEGRAV